MKGPLSNRATISIIAGAIIAGTIAMIMAVKEEKESSPYEDILFQEKLRAGYSRSQQHDSRRSLD
jgi:hypothetical protein